jgi:autophagy-related protein 9
MTINENLNESLLQQEINEDLDNTDIDDNLDESIAYVPSNKKLIQIYNYFYHKGYYNIVSLQIFNLLTSIFMLVFLNFMFTCIDYKGLKQLREEETSFKNYIDFSNFYKNNFIYIFTTIIIILYITVRVIGIGNDITDYYKIKKFYNKKLNIDNRKIDTITWEEIVEKLELLYGNDYNIYNTNMKILKKDNIITTILSSNINKFLYSRLIEWNIIYCIFDYLFDNNYNIKENIYTDRNKIVKKIKQNLFIISVLTYLFMPLLIVYLFFYSFLKYGEKFYNNPSKITSKQWSLKAKWKLRYYNELKHELKERLNKSSQYADAYCNIFNYKIVSTICKFIIFVFSSFFIMLLLLSFYNEHLLLNLNVSKNKPILWYLGILGSIIALGKNITKEKNMEKINCIDKLAGYIRYLPKRFKDEYNSTEIKKSITNIFEYQIYTFLKEYFSVLIIPYSLIYLSNYVDNIIDVILDNVEYDNNLGYIDKNSNFRTLNDKSGDKKIISFSEFRNRYHNWGANIELYQIGDNSKIIHRSIKKEETGNIQTTYDSNISII